MLPGSIRPKSLLVLVPLFLVTLAPAQQRLVPSRIMKAINETTLTVLKGNTHPLARAAFDRGAASPDLPMNRMLLVLRRAPEQEAGLESLLDQQQDKASRSYHAWVSPEEFGQRFGRSGHSDHNNVAGLHSLQVDRARATSTAP